MSIENKRREVVLTREAIESRVAELGKALTEAYADKNMLIISLLKGSFIFTADLVRKIDLPLRIEFMTTSSYGHGESSSGSIEVIQDVDVDLTGYDVLVVDDITDSAVTMTGVMALLKSRNPRSLRACVLLDKPSRRRIPYEPDFVGFEIPDQFIVGYGLNYGDYFRNIDHVFAFVD